jgi:predicted metal-dependent hydrolase
MTIKKIIEEIQKRSKKELSVKVAEYKSTYISVRRDQKSIKLSIHKLFLQAPESILNHLINFVVRRDKLAFIEIKKYAHNYFLNVDYSKFVKDENLNFIGKIYNLKQILENLNKKYFNDSLDLKITYFETKYKKYSHFTFGSYDNTLKLIRINKILDSINVPFYFVYYVVYHEMLHHILKVDISKDAKRKVHSKEFKILEKKFPYYKEAIDWEKNIFNKRKVNGGTF